MTVNELKKMLEAVDYPDDADVVIETSGGFRATVSGVWTEPEQVVVKTVMIP